MKQEKNIYPPVPSIDDYVIRRKAWTYLDAKGDKVTSNLINLAAAGIHRLS